MTDIDLTPTPLNPTSQFILSLSTADPMQDMAFHRVLERALDAYHTIRHQAAYWADADKPDAERDGVIAAIASAAPGIVAFALHRVVESLHGQLTEEQTMAIADTAAALDLGVVEDITGANGTGEDDAGPEVRAFHDADGWTVPYEPGTQACTINHVPEDEGRQTCASTAVWKVVEQRGFGLTLSFWCDADLPNEHRHLAVRPDA